MMKVAMISTVVSETGNTIIRDVPVSSAIVELNDGALAIIDTGMAGHDGLLDELDWLGLNPDDFRLVINTHLHPDHIGGNQLFTRARIIISRRELQYEKKVARILKDSPDPRKALQSLGRCVTNMSRQMASDLKLLAEEYPVERLVGDPGQIEFFEDQPRFPEGLSCMAVPGHSIGSRAVLITGIRRRAVAAGDALYHRDWRQGISELGIHYNEKLFLHNAERLDDLPDIIIPGHDRWFDNLNRRSINGEWMQL